MSNKHLTNPSKFHQEEGHFHLYWNILQNIIAINNCALSLLIRKRMHALLSHHEATKNHNTVYCSLKSEKGKLTFFGYPENIGMLRVV